MPVKIEKTKQYYTVNALIKKLQQSKRVAKVGWFEGAKYENGASVAEVAYTQEYGSKRKHIPARPFVRPAIREDQKLWANTAMRLIKKIAREGGKPSDILKLTSEQVISSIRKKITEVHEPPLAPATIRARERKRGLKRGKLSKTGSKPLIDTGLLRVSTSYKIENE